MRRKIIFKSAFVLSAVLFSSAFLKQVSAQESDYEFPPPWGWGSLSETGDDDASSRLAEGFEGLDAEPTKNTTIEPVDGAGGFDNVAPRLGAEEGPGGLDWDPSPTYRTRYSGATDYVAGSGKRLQGNNWFLTIPYVILYSSTIFARFDANTYRVYTLSGGVYWGQLGNLNSKITETGSAGSRIWKLHDTRGKIYTFEEASPASGRMTKLEGLGGAQITISYGSTITILQKPSATSGNEVRRFTYYTNMAQTRLDKIDIEEKVSGSWTLYRKIDFTYHEDISGAVEGSSGDLIGIKEETLLSPSSTWLERKHVFKYFTGSYNSSTNPGYPYQVKAVLGPQSVRDFEVANPSTVIYTQTAAQLASYVDRVYEYASDKRCRQIDFKSGCGCGGGEGVYGYAWDVNGTPPSDQNTWSHRVTITLPSVNGSSRIIDFNKYGEKLNAIAQEVAGDSSSRRWIQTWAHDTTGRLTDSYSVKACTSYTDSTHTVTTNTTAGMRNQFAYDSNSALTTVKLRDPANGNWNYQRKKAFSFLTSSDRRRFVKTSDTVYPTETTTDTGGLATSWSYTYHTSDALAVKKRTTTLPTIASGENGSGSAVTTSVYFETDGLETWSKDGEGYVHYTGYDTQRRTVTKTVRNIDTDTADRPSGVPAPPSGEGFDSSTGLNIVQDFEYDYLRRPTKHILPAFNAWNGSSIVSTSTTRRWFYTKLSGGEAVTVEYPHLGASYSAIALGLTVRDYEGHVVTSAQGQLTTGDTDLTNDVDTTDSTIAVAFNGTIIARTDFTYSGSKLTKEEVWSVATNGSAAKYTTEHTFDAAGVKLTTKTPAGTITRWSSDVLNRVKTQKVGTVDGGGSDNMTLIDERFYDDEEDTSTYVGEGNLTRLKRYTENGGTSRTTDLTYDYRRRETQRDEPLSVRETRTYTNQNQLKVISGYDTTSGTTLMEKSENFYDAWGQVYEVRTSGVSAGTESGYSNVKTWRNSRGLVIKTRSQGTVFEKSQYDGAGRVTNRAVSYDTAETAYADADDLTSDTVMEETRLTYDKTGAVELQGHYQRHHNGSGTGGLTVNGGNSRPQFIAFWYDPFHRVTNTVNYGTNADIDLTSRPSGSPPSESSSTVLVTKSTYTVKSQLEDTIQFTCTLAGMPTAIAVTTRNSYDDPGHLTKKIENYVDGTPGSASDEDRTTEYTYNSSGQLQKIAAKSAFDDSGTYRDLTTEYVYGVTRGTDNSKLSSNDLVKTIKYPDPDSSPPGTPSSDANDQDTSGYSALGELVWKKDPSGTEHVFDYDDRGRLIHDRATVIASGLSTTIKRITRTYDALDRPLKVTSYDNATVGSGTVKNEAQYVYTSYNLVGKLYQERYGAVNVNTSRKVEYGWTDPTDGTTAVRRNSVKHSDGVTVTDVYNTGMDDTLSRISGQKQSTTWLFQESYLGLSRVVQREYGDTGYYWTVLSLSGAYTGLDRFNRIEELKVTNFTTTRKDYTHIYNYRSQVLLREDLVGNVSGTYEFDELHEYDKLGRLTDHKRGIYASGAMNTIRVHECWTLDRSGNTTAYYSGTSSGCTPSTTTATFNASNELATWSAGTVTYDAAGNMTRRGSWYYTYDAWNRFVKVTWGGSIELSSYEYNGLAHKIARTGSSLPNLEYYHTEHWQMLDEIKESDGSVYNWYIWGTQYIDDMVVQKPIGTTKYTALDSNYNRVAVLDSNAVPESHLAFEQYGYPLPLNTSYSWISISDDLYAFTNRQYHKDHQQNDYRHRTEAPEVYSFIQRDPIGIWGDKGNFGNEYAYVGNDAVNRSDPLGLQDCNGYTAIFAVAGSSVALTESGAISRAKANALRDMLRHCQKRVCKPRHCAQTPFQQTCEGTVRLIRWISVDSDPLGTYNGLGMEWDGANVVGEFECSCNCHWFLLPERDKPIGHYFVPVDTHNTFVESQGGTSPGISGLIPAVTRDGAYSLGRQVVVLANSNSGGSRQ